jgi:hypothetical protein
MLDKNSKICPSYKNKRSPTRSHTSIIPNLPFQSGRSYKYGGNYQEEEEWLA